MINKRPAILAMRRPDASWAPVPDGVVCIEVAESMPTETKLADLFWDYIHIGLDCRVLDGRIFEIAGEYVAAETPDLLVLSTPTQRFLTGCHTNSAYIFECLCHMAMQGTLYAFGNKLISRGLWSVVMGASTQTECLTKTFLCLKKMALLSHPWVEVHAASAPTDAEFSSLIEHYTTQREPA